MITLKEEAQWWVYRTKRMALEKYEELEGMEPLRG